MTFGRYLAGLALLAVTLAPIVLASVRARGALVPSFTGAAARLAEAVLSLALLLTVAHVLGAVGLFRPGFVAVASVLTGALVLWRVPKRASPPGPAPPAVGRAGLLLAAAGTAVLVGHWMTGVVDALDEGMYGSDTLRYHGPVAARFVQEHGITGLHFLLNDPTLTFFPFDSELLHALGILFMGNDVLSPLLNVGWLAVALLAAWCVGRPFGVGPATLLAAALVLASPALAQSQPGSGDNDVVALALLLATAALLLQPQGGRAPAGLAGLAAGIALGTKLTVFGMVGAITAGLAVVTPRGSRRGVVLVWLAALLATGGFWFARNLFAIGNPLPWFGFGPLGLPSPPFLDDPSVAHYITDSNIWTDVYFPGFHDRFGSVWIVVFVLALAGMGLALVRGSAPMLRMLGGVGVVGLAAYALSPNTAAGPEGFPIFFSATARYVAPALALGLVLLPVVPLVRPLARRPWAQALLLGLMLATLTNQGIEPLDASRALGAVACAALIAVLLWRPPRRLVVAAGALLVLLVVVAGWRVADRFMDDRYAEGAFAFARGIHDSRVALVGSNRQYHLYGSDLSNHVQYVGRRGPAGAYTSVRSCREWRRALDAGRYRYVVVTPANELFGTYTEERPPELGWTSSAPGARVLLHEPGGATLLGLSGPLGTRGCPGAPG
jgi:hypothetical protein